MAPHAETAGQIQSVHGLGLQFPKHGPAHGLQLLVQLLAELGAETRRTVTVVLEWGVSEALCLRNISSSAEAGSQCET